MVRQSVQSSMIKAWAFDSETGVMELEFTNGRIYQYADVPAFLARGFAAATSKGQFFLSRIDDRYNVEEVHPSNSTPRTRPSSL
jgi:hypothetical protein